jgi:hypothetical protein
MVPRAIRSQLGFSLLEIMIVVGLMGVTLLGLMAMQRVQVKSNSFLHFQLKKTEIQAALLSQFLNYPINCGCLFKNANAAPFAENVVGHTLNVARPPTELGRYSFSTPGDCATATVPSPFVTAGGIDGVRLADVSMTDVTGFGGGVFSGRIQVLLRAAREVAGPSEIRLVIPVNVTTTPAAPGQVNFDACSTVSTSEANKTLAILEAKASYTAGMMFWMGGGGGHGRTVSTCGGGSFVYGFSGRSGSLIDGLRLHCKSHDATTTSVGNYVGTGGGSAFGLISCPPGSFGSGIRGRAGGRVDRFGLECRDTSTGNVTTTLQAGGFGGFARSFSCPLGSYLFELRAQTGDEFDSLEVVCADLPP